MAIKVGSLNKFVEGKGREPKTIKIFRTRVEIP